MGFGESTLCHASIMVEPRRKLKPSLPKTESDEQPRYALRIQSRSGWGEWGRWRQQQPIRLCPIDAADGWMGWPVCRLRSGWGKPNFRPKKKRQQSALVLRGGWRAEPSAFSLGGGKRGPVASRSAASSVVVCSGGRASQEPKRVCSACSERYPRFFFGGALEIVEPEAVIDFFFLATRSLALAKCLATQRKAKQALELVSAAELDGGLLTLLLLLLSPCWRWRCRAKATASRRS